MTHFSWRGAIALCAVALLAAAPAPVGMTPAQAVAIAAHNDAQLASCAKSESAAKLAAATSVKAIGGGLTLANVQSACLCGNANCPYYVIAGGATPKVVYATFAISAKAVPVPGNGAPDLLFTAHDSALIANEARLAYRNGSYVPVSLTRVRGDTNARKPVSVPVQFTAGASSATLTGSVAPNWGDVYTFTAKPGQTLTVRGSGNVTATLWSGTSRPLPLGTPIALPPAGSYRLSIDPAGTDEKPVRYRLTLSITG